MEITQSAYGMPGNKLIRNHKVFKEIGRCMFGSKQKGNQMTLLMDGPDKFLFSSITLIFSSYRYT